jgi:hypothetical protein
LLKSDRESCAYVLTFQALVPDYNKEVSLGYLLDIKGPSHQISYAQNWNGSIILGGVMRRWTFIIIFYIHKLSLYFYWAFEVLM